MVQDRRHQLTERQFGLLAIGGTVGAGLFLGVGEGLRTAGSALLLLFAIAALLAWAVTHALGELVMAKGLAATYLEAAGAILGRRLMFVQGWGYWSAAILACMAQLTGAGLILHGIIHTPVWLSALIALGALALIQRLSVHAVGQVEVWLTSIKVATLVLILLLGIVALLHPLWEGSPGLDGIVGSGRTRAPGSSWLRATPLALFSFGNAEIIGIAAAELEQGAGRLRRAIRNFILRLAVLNLGVAAAVLVLIPMAALPKEESPFVTVFVRCGLPYAHEVIAVILISVMISSCNSCLYGANRVLEALAAQGCAPRALTVRNARGAPAYALGLTLVGVVLAIVLHVFVPTKAFGLLLAAAAIFGLANWTLILIAHLKLRRGAAPGDILALAGVGAAAVEITLQPAFTLATGLALAILSALALLFGLKLPVTCRRGAA